MWLQINIFKLVPRPRRYQFCLQPLTTGVWRASRVPGNGDRGSENRIYPQHSGVVESGLSVGCTTFWRKKKNMSSCWLQTSCYNCSLPGSPQGCGVPRAQQLFLAAVLLRRMPRASHVPLPLQDSTVWVTSCPRPGSGLHPSRSPSVHLWLPAAALFHSRTGFQLRSKASLWTAISSLMDDAEHEGSWK